MLNSYLSLTSVSIEEHITSLLSCMFSPPSPKRLLSNNILYLPMTGTCNIYFSLVTGVKLTAIRSFSLSLLILSYARTVSAALQLSIQLNPSSLSSSSYKAFSDLYILLSCEIYISISLYSFSWNLFHASFTLSSPVMSMPVSFPKEMHLAPGYVYIYPSAALISASLLFLLLPAASSYIDEPSSAS